MTNTNKTWVSDEEYKRINEVIPIVSINLLVNFENKVLLVYRNNEPAKGEWWIPGGRIIKNETFQETISRLTTNFGIEQESIIEIKQLHAHEFIRTEKNENENENYHHVSIVFLLKVNEKPNLPNNIKQKWTNEIDSNLDPYVQGILKENFSIILK
jgi:colanic acid biosynthesis protein WcaH